jgi:hypothetical protein
MLCYGVGTTAGVTTEIIVEKAVKKGIEYAEKKFENSDKKK